MYKIAAIIALVFFAFTAQAQIDTAIGIKAPKKLSKNYKKLAHHLCDSLDTDHQKVNAIYNWVTHNVKYDVKSLQKGALNEVTTKKILKKRRALCGGYAQLIVDLCNEVHIPAVMIDGYAKDWMFDNGDKFYIPRHAWNAVYVDYKWQLIDATWGAGGVGQSPGWLKQQTNKMSGNKVSYSGKLKFKFSYDSSFFLSQPASFRIRHLPTDPVWQLTDSTMPLFVFEAGEQAILDFNAHYSEPKQSDLSLNQLARMNEWEKALAKSEREYAYNPRFSVAMAVKHQATAVEAIANEKKNIGGREGVLKAVNSEVKTAGTFLADQRKALTVEYRDLKKKNKTKNLEAKKYIASIHTANKRLIAQCKTIVKSADTRNSGVERKASSFVYGNRTLDAGKLDKIKTMANEEEETSPALKTLEDSVNNRNQRIATLKTEEATLLAKIDALKQVHSKRLDTLADQFNLADSALVEETIGRVNMHDNYDDVVIKWNTIVKQVRLKDVDSQQHYFKASYDSTLASYEALRKVLTLQSDLYKKSLKNIEQYKRKNGSNTTFLASYSSLMNEQKRTSDTYLQAMSKQSGFIKGNKNLFEQLIKLYERQEKLAGYMEKAEEHRKDLEEKSLVKKEEFDKKENEKQKATLDQTSRRAEKIL